MKQSVNHLVVTHGFSSGLAQFREFSKWTGLFEKDKFKITQRILANWSAQLTRIVDIPYSGPGAF